MNTITVLKKTVHTIDDSRRKSVTRETTRTAMTRFETPARVITRVTKTATGTTTTAWLITTADLLASFRDLPALSRRYRTRRRRFRL